MSKNTMFAIEGSISFVLLHVHYIYINNYVSKFLCRSPALFNESV